MSTILTDHGFLPLSSLRLIVPPLQLVSAALWEIVKQGAVMYYGLLEEFVATVLETVPELLTDTERVQLVMGLRAKVVLDLCCSDDFASPLAIQPHLNRINSYIKNQDEETSSSEVKTSVTNFLKLVNTLVDDQCQRKIFYQKIFPTVFGSEYDSALQALMRKFLLNLQKLLPVPNLEQTSLWLSLSPSLPLLKECVDFMNQPEPLNTLIQHHKHHGHQVPQATSSSVDDCILSSLSYLLPSVGNVERGILLKSESVCVSQGGKRDNLLGSESKEVKEEENLVEINSELLRSVEQQPCLLGSESAKVKEEFNFTDINSELVRNVETYGHDLNEDQGASIEVTLQAYDESESNDDEETDVKWSLPLKTGSRTSSKSFKCLICDKNFASLNKLKTHKITHSGSITNNLNLSKPNPADETEESLPCETETWLSNVAVQESSDSPEEQTSKRSSRVKQCSVCREIFTCSVDLMSHMRCHTDNEFDSYNDYETHQEGKCRVSKQHSQDNPSSNAKKSTKDNPSVIGPVPTITDAPANSQAMQLCASTLTCQKCGQVFAYNKNFKKHQIKCTKRAKSKALQLRKSLITCQDCGRVFVYSKNFENHQSKCTKRLPRKKKKTFPNYANFSIISGCNFQSADHSNGSHEGASSETAETPNSAGHADDSEAKPHIIKCTMCEMKFSKIRILSIHYSKAHKVRDAYPCSLCKRTFMSLSELVRHQQNQILYQCASCKKCFLETYLNDHECKHTASVTPHICETCGKRFRILSYLVLHQRKHRKKEPNICSYCGKQYSSKQCLKEHMIRHTEGLSCPVCGKKFFRKLYLEWHLYKHTGKEPYRCNTCGKGWPTAAHLKLHMIQHSEERPFKCENCGVCYKRKNHLNAHRRDVHMKVRQFSCSVCSKAFRLRGELKRHKMVHRTTQSGRFTNKRYHSNSARTSSLCEKLKLHLKPTTCTDNEASRSETELPLLSSTTTHSPSHPESLPNFAQANDDCSLVCHICARVFTYRKSFDKHQKICVVGCKQQAETDQECSTSLAYHSSPNLADETEESLLCETESRPSSLSIQESSDLPHEQACNRSSRAKQCSICREIFTCSIDLMSHMRCHTEQIPYLCSYCGREFDSYKDYEIHQEEECRVSMQPSQDNPSSNAKKSTEENPVISSVTGQVPTITDAPANSEAMQLCASTLTCQKCGQVFAYSKNFEKHQTKCSKRAKSKALKPSKSRITCQDCGRVFVHSKNFENHQSKCTKRLPRKKKKTFPNYANYSIISGCNFQSADHTNRSHDEASSETAETPISADHADDSSSARSQTFKCTMCEKKFSKIWLMNLHYSKAHKVRDTYPCSLCKRSFVRLSELVRHQQNRKLYQCASCKKCFSETYLNDHECKDTGCETPHTCETCGKRFKVLSYLVLHQKKHKEQEPNICSYCGKQYSSKQCLKDHMVRHTGGYPCQVCGKKFNQKTYLKWHLYKHTGKALYLCDTCGKGWPTAAQLKVHMIQHSEERPFKCEDCGVCYKREGHLNAHRRAVHIRLRPFICEVCSKAFRLNCELKQHMMVHTGERPFACPRCGKKFIRKFHLRQHSKKACR